MEDTKQEYFKLYQKANEIKNQVGEMDRKIITEEFKDEVEILNEIKRILSRGDALSSGRGNEADGGKMIKGIIGFLSSILNLTKTNYLSISYKRKENYDKKTNSFH